MLRLIRPWRRPVLANCRILCSNVRGLSGNLSDQAVALSKYDILLCSETLVSDLHHVSELLVPVFGRAVFLCRGKLPRARGMAAYVRDGYGAFHNNQNFSVVVVECWLLGFVI